MLKDRLNSIIFVRENLLTALAARHAVLLLLAHLAPVKKRLAFVLSFI